MPKFGKPFIIPFTRNKIKTQPFFIYRFSYIRFIGFVPDEEMPALYSAAEVFAFPTLYEGFGIPVLEAQACGTPVLTSNCTALPEVGGDAAVYADPYDVNDIAEKMKHLMINPVLRVELQKKDTAALKNRLRYH